MRGRGEQGTHRLVEEEADGEEPAADIVSRSEPAAGVAESGAGARRGGESKKDGEWKSE